MSFEINNNGEVNAKFENFIISNDKRNETSNLQICLNLCKNLFGGIWKIVDESNVLFKNISLGFINTTYVCLLDANKLKLSKDIDVPSKILFRKYGSESNTFSFKEKFRLCNSEIEEALIIQKLSSENISPKLLGVFNGGRIEEFVEGRTLLATDLKDKEITLSIARQLARLHSLDLPLKKNVNFTELCIALAIVDVKKDLNVYEAKYQEHLKKFLSFDVRGECDWIKAMINKLDTKLVFSHNDLNFNNILKVENRKEKVLFIDFDGSCYYYRGNDLGYFICYQQYNILSENNNPRLQIERAIDKNEFRKVFLNEYFDELTRLKIKQPALQMPQSLDEMDCEVKIFELFNSILLVGFALTAIENDSYNQFNSAESFCCLCDEYYMMKTDFIKKYPLL